jgi:hypothetical protein
MNIKFLSNCKFQEEFPCPGILDGRGEAGRVAAGEDGRGGETGRGVVWVNVE